MRALTLSRPKIIIIIKTIMNMNWNNANTIAFYLSNNLFHYMIKVKLGKFCKLFEDHIADNLVVGRRILFEYYKWLIKLDDYGNII